MKTNLWLTVLTIALVLNMFMMRNTAEGDAAPGIRKEHLNPAPGAFVDGSTIEIGENGLKVADNIAQLGTFQSFTPQIHQGVDVATTVNNARYTQIGNMVFVTCNLTAAGAGTAGQPLIIADFPKSIRAGGCLGSFVYNDAGTKVYGGQIFSQAYATPAVYLRVAGDVSHTNGAIGSDINLAIASGDTIYFSFMYETTE